MRSHGLPLFFALIAQRIGSTSAIPINNPAPLPSPNDLQTLYPEIGSVFTPLCQRNNNTNLWQNFTLQVPGEVPITPVPVPEYKPLAVEIALNGQTPVSCQSVGVFAFENWNVAQNQKGNTQTLCLPGKHKYALTVTLDPVAATPGSSYSGDSLVAPSVAVVRPWYSQPGGEYQNLQENDLGQHSGSTPDPRKFRHIGELQWELPTVEGPNPQACMNVHFEFEFKSGVGVQNTLSGAVALWDVPGSPQKDAWGYTNDLPEDTLMETTGIDPAATARVSSAAAVSTSTMTSVTSPNTVGATIPPPAVSSAAAAPQAGANPASSPAVVVPGFAEGFVAGVNAGVAAGGGAVATPSQVTKALPDGVVVASNSSGTAPVVSIIVQHGGPATSDSATIL